MRPFVVDDVDKLPKAPGGMEFQDFNQHSSNRSFQSLSITQAVVIYTSAILSAIVAGGILWTWANKAINSYGPEELVGHVVYWLLIASTLFVLVTSLWVGFMATYTQLKRMGIVFDQAHTPVSVFDLDKMQIRELIDLHYEVQRILAQNSATRGVVGSVYTEHKNETKYPVGFDHN
jgi:hypothetical protein